MKAVAVGPEQPLVDMPKAPAAEHEVGNRVLHQLYSGGFVGIQIATSTVKAVALTRGLFVNGLSPYSDMLIQRRQVTN